MEEIEIIDEIEDNESKKKIYREGSIGVGTFIGGPLVGGYFIAENFAAFGENKKAKITWAVAIAFTVSIITFILLIPEDTYFPNYLFTLIYTVATVHIARYYQKDSTLEYKNSGGKFFSWWRTVGIGLLGTVLTFLIILGISLLVHGTEEFTHQSKQYGEMGNQIDYYSDNISEEEVDEIAKGLKSINYFNEFETSYVFVEKVNDSYEISISILEEVVGNDEVNDQLQKYRDDLQDHFPNNKIVFVLVVNHLDNVVERLE